MIDTYTELKNIVDSHWLLVAYRYLRLKKEEGINAFFIPEEIINAFKDEGFESREDIWKMIALKFSKVIKYDANALTQTINILNKEELHEAEIDGSPYIVPKCRLTTEGVEEAEEQLKEIYGDNILSDKPLAEQLGLAKEGTAPAADRIVELDHNSPPYKEAMSALDEVIEAVDNERKNDFEEKERVQKELQAGKTLLSALRVDPEKIKATLIKTLKWIGVKFAENAIANLAVKAVKAIAALIGISI